MIGSAKSCYSVRVTCIQDVPGARKCQHVLGSVRDCQGNTREHLRCSLWISIYIVAIAGPREFFSMENYLRCIHCIKERGSSMLFCMCL